jgi:hypothetical protein
MAPELAVLHRPATANSPSTESAYSAIWRHAASEIKSRTVTSAGLTSGAQVSAVLLAQTASRLWGRPPRRSGLVLRVGKQLRTQGTAHADFVCQTRPIMIGRSASGYCLADQVASSVTRVQGRRCRAWTCAGPANTNRYQPGGGGAGRLLMATWDGGGGPVPGRDHRGGHRCPPAPRWRVTGVSLVSKGWRNGHRHGKRPVTDMPAGVTSVVPTDARGRV